MALIPIHFIDEQVEVQFDEPPVYRKSPVCPSGFVWQGRPYQIAEKVGEWQDFERRGRMAQNMAPAHAAAASRRGSWGVGRFFFRVRTREGALYDLYYDRAPKNADDRLGAWFLYRELEEKPDRAEPPF
ncbi:MAG: DUF6504 family protein [Anaerolineaceae bacterium]